jgi:U3 small nucleolar ribonucleoprotein protein LCP5
VFVSNYALRDWNTCTMLVDIHMCESLRETADGVKIGRKGTQSQTKIDADWRAFSEPGETQKVAEVFFRNFLKSPNDLLPLLYITTMSMESTVLDTLSSFTTAAEAATEALPNVEALLPPPNGISLLDAKNEIFLSYLQALALRNLNVIRSLKEGSSAGDAQKLSIGITSKLIEHRVYLERGVRPLEQKIKYEADKAIKAADDEERAAAQKGKRPDVSNGISNSEGEPVNRADDGSDVASSEDENSEQVEQRSFQPNQARMRKSSNPSSEQLLKGKSREDGVYRPPRISATAMPTTEQRERKERRPGRSATLDEYVNTELSNAPLSVPSIGSTIAQGGRKTKDARQMAKEQERRDYEETHLMRLPKESKKELAKQKAKDRRGGFGGEEWRGLGDAVDRVGDLTKRKSKEGALEKSRKRRAVEDGPRSDGIGNAFDVKKRRVMKKMKR